MWKRDSDPESYDPQHSYAAKQLSRYDMQVAGVVVYVVTMAMLFVVALVMMLFWNEPVRQARAQGLKGSTPLVQSARAVNPRIPVQPRP
jgi:peptidoglycan/LPS O-acetylase OafA/YrhL